MLCKTTMRAALAHVLGIVGIIGAFGASAAADSPYAAESLTGSAPYSIKGSPMGKIVLDVEIDTLIPAATYYLAVNFWSAQLTDQLGVTYEETTPDTAGVQGDPNSDPPVATVQPRIGTGTGFRFYTVTDSVRPSATGVTPAVTGVDGTIATVTGITIERAYRGDKTDTSGVYQVVVPAALAIDTHVRLDLSNNLAVRTKGAATYRADLYIYENLGDARVAARATAPGDVPSNHLFADHSPLFEVKSKIATPKVTPHLATADVGYERPQKLDANDNVLVTSGGPFRGFVAEGESTKNVGVLATIMLNQVADSDPTKSGNQAFLNAATGMALPATHNANTGARIVVKAKAGAFGFGNGAGDGRMGEVALKGDNPGTDKVEDADHTYHAGGAPRAFMASTSKECENNPLTLRSGTPLTAINPNDRDNPTFSKEATQGDATVRGIGPFYFCVLVSENEVEIPNIGDDRDLDGYEITVTPMNGTSPGPVLSGANGGSVDRNGTSVNITYLSTEAAYNQVLVIVNRGTREAEFWMTEFQTEGETMVDEEGLRGTVAAGSRVTRRIQDELTIMKGNRASGTLNLTAPTNEVDVMTIQFHPGTGQVDTTIYQ